MHPTSTCPITLSLVCFSDNTPSSLSILGTLSPSHSLASVQVPLPFDLPNEFSSFAHFPPSERVPLPEGSNHVFSFQFVKDSTLPKGCPIYISNLRAQESLNTYITDMLSRGLIVPSTSLVVSPVLLVPKANGTLRPCVDFKRLNAVTESDHYPMPLMPDIVQMITESVIFSKLDLKDAFNQIPVKE